MDEIDDYDFYADIMTAIPLSNKIEYRIMVFVDGENLSARFGEILDGQDIPDHVKYQKDIYVWSQYLNHFFLGFDVVRKYYYTSVIGDNDKADETADILKKQCSMEEPKIFKKTKTRGSKGIDISLATDMLTHANKKNYDIAILVAGDGDYVPLVEAVKREGCRVFVWFLRNGLHKKLEQTADSFWDMGKVLLEKDHKKLMGIMRFHGA